MMSLFRKESSPPASSGEAQPKGAYDLDIEADGDDPATAASVVSALLAKYKKNVRHPASDRARRPSKGGEGGGRESHPLIFHPGDRLRAEKLRLQNVRDGAK